MSPNGRQIRHKSVIKMFAEAPTEAVRVVGQANGSREGSSAANLKAAELYVGAFKELAKVEPQIKMATLYNFAPINKAEHGQYQLSHFAVESGIPSEQIESDLEGSKDY